MGQHDPLDGYITTIQLISTTAKLPEQDAGPNLANEISQFATMIKGGEWATVDPLGIGGLLVDAYRADCLLRQGAALDELFIESLLSAALVGLEYYARSNELRQQAEYRLGFRELGLAIGLHVVELMRQAAGSETQRSSTSAGVYALLQALIQFASIRDEIESYWLDPDHRRASSWNDHRDINEVMLATSLAPDGFLIK
jgi:hypothetical protein